MTHFSVEHRDPATEHFEQHLREAIPNHFGRLLGGEPQVFHELVSDHMHLDVFIWAPSSQRNVWTFVTAGMSGHPMNVPTEMVGYERSELVLTLPPEWPPLDDIQRMSRSKAKRSFWPIRELKNLARLPYLYNTWLGPGHTTRAGQTLYDTYAGSQYSGMLIESVSSMPNEYANLEVAGEPIHCYGVYPLFTQELRYILDHPFSGRAHEMFHRLIDAGLHEGVFPERHSLA